MPQFFNIAAGEERSGPGIRVKVRDDGEAVWMHGKWLDLDENHAVIVPDGKAEFFRLDVRRLAPGDFPAWVVRGKGKHLVIAIMFSVTQFRGGKITVKDRFGTPTDYAVAA